MPMLVLAYYRPTDMEASEGQRHLRRLELIERTQTDHAKDAASCLFPAPYLAPQTPRSDAHAHAHTYPYPYPYPYHNHHIVPRTLTLNPCSNVLLYSEVSHPHLPCFNQIRNFLRALGISLVHTQASFSDLEQNGWNYRYAAF